VVAAALPAEVKGTPVEVAEEVFPRVVAPQAAVAPAVVAAVAGTTNPLSHGTC